MSHIKSFKKLSALLWAVTQDISRIIFSKYNSLIEKRLVDEIPHPTAFPIRQYCLNVKFNNEAVEELCELNAVKEAANYLVRRCGFRHESKPREDIEAHLKIYTHDLALSFTNDLLECIEQPPITKAVFDYVVRARYRTKPRQISILPLYHLRPNFDEFKIAPSLCIRQLNKFDRHILYCSPFSRSPIVETVLSYERDLSKAIDAPIVPELNALEFFLHLFIYSDFCSVNTYQYRTSGLMPKGHSGTVSHHATPFEGGDVFFLLKGDLIKVKKYFAGVKRFFTKSQFTGACLRFNESFRRGTRGCIPNDEDRLIDLCLAYEGLFSDRGDNTGISYKLAHRGAITLKTKVVEERIVEYKRLKSSYNTRNTLLHGGQADRGEITKAIRIFERALRRGFLFCIERKLFEHNEWLKHCIK